MLFKLLHKCHLNVERGGGTDQRDMEFIEEFWPGPCKDRKGIDTLCDEFGWHKFTLCIRNLHSMHQKFTGTSPNKVYNVIDIAQIIGPAPITPDPANPTIPNGAFNGISQYRRKNRFEKWSWRFLCTLWTSGHLDGDCRVCRCAKSSTIKSSWEASRAHPL